MILGYSCEYSWPKNHMKSIIDVLGNSETLQNEEKSNYSIGRNVLLYHISSNRSPGQLRGLVFEGGLY